MEGKVDYLERTVENTDRKLEDLSWKMEKWERAVSQVSLFEETSPQLESEQEDCVFNLLQDVTQVREDYEQLRSDITEIQQLQKELSECLRSQLHHMHAKYGFLRSKLGPALPSCLMMSTNSYRASPTKHTDRETDDNRHSNRYKSLDSAFRIPFQHQPSFAFTEIKQEKRSGILLTQPFPTLSHSQVRTVKSKGDKKPNFPPASSKR